MREFKFRGWDGEKILPPQDLSQGINYWDWLGKNDVQLMQFTGLKDKKGKEIYEGDVLEGDSSFRINKPVVKFDDAEFKCGAFPLSTLDMGRMQIIGNIYENPELMEAISTK